MSASTVTTLRAPADYAGTLNATAADIDAMSMDTRLELVRALRSGPATRLGAGDRWRNIEGVVTFFRDNAMGAPGTWVSHVNAGVLESIERGLAIALGISDDDFDNPGSAGWAKYLTRLRANELTTKSAHDRAWSEAKEVSTDYGVALAEDLHGLKPTDAERRFLLFAQFYNWGMRNRPILDLIVAYGGLYDARLANLRPDFLDWFMSVGNADAARRGCEIAYAAAQVEPAPEAFGVFQLALGEMPRLFDIDRGR
jgi:hypothetical protein